MRGRKRGRIGDFSDFADSSDLLARFSCACVVSDYSRAAITLADYSRAAGIIYFSNGYAYLVYYKTWQKMDPVDEHVRNLAKMN